jgi:TnsA endonuclease N terminal
MGEKKFLQGKYTPHFPEKYKGNPCEIYYRSSWERRFMKYCDFNKRILEWGSEEFFLPYRSPLDGKIHRYFPDFYVKMKDDDGKIKKYIIEVKPKKQTIEPEVKKRKTKGYIYEVMEYAKNQAKWKAAKEFCEDRQWEFKVITEDDLGL